MLEALDQHFPDDTISRISWTRPAGGIFLWVTLPAGMDAGQLFEQAVAEKVVFVPGSNYFANGGGGGTMRLNFSAYDEETISLGIKRLATVIHYRQGKAVLPGTGKSSDDSLAY